VDHADLDDDELVPSTRPRSRRARARCRHVRQAAGDLSIVRLPQGSVFDAKQPAAWVDDVDLPPLVQVRLPDKR
jgi:hypothetical protein